MEQPIKKKFLTLPDLAFGFFHKRSGNEINHSYDYRPNWTPLSPITITYYK